MFFGFVNAGQLFYSTYLGGAGNELGYGIAVDTGGNAYITGYTSCSNFPTTNGAFDTSFNSGSYDAFVTKLNPSGSGLVYSTFVGGNDDDYGYGIVVDVLGNAYLTGITKSPDFPITLGTFDTSYNGADDVFVTKLNASGTVLVYSTYLGGSYSDSGNSIAVDGFGNAYITGETHSSDFPTTTGAYDTSYHLSFNTHLNSDVFVSKLNSIGTMLVYSTYLGTQMIDIAHSIALDATGDAYITGETQSTEFPTTDGAWDTTINSTQDGFVTKLNQNGTGLVYSTYLGGNGMDYSMGIAVDAIGNAYITGYTYGDFPTTVGAFDTSVNNGFVSRLNSSGTGLIYSTGLGEYCNAYAIAVDAFSNAYITGETGMIGNEAVVVKKLNPSGTELIYSTHLNGNSYNKGYGIAVDDSGNAYITGGTASSNFPTTTGAFDTSNNGGYDVFVSKLSVIPTAKVEPSVWMLYDINEGKR